MRKNKPNDAAQSSKRAQVYGSLIEQLALKRIEQQCYKDMVGDYMSLWDVKDRLIADIETRGVVFKDVSAAGNEMQKNNPSTKELVMVNNQMLKVLKELGLSADKAGASDGEEL